MSKTTDWPKRARTRLNRILKLAQAEPALRKLGPKGCRWIVDVRLVGSAAMKRLNSRYRHKDYATDVLSFWTQEPFRSIGQLGDLVICLPVLKRQAKELGHSPEIELDVLLAHGLLHLLGMDHEKGGEPAREMARAEARLLGKLRSRGLPKGLIERAG